MHIPLPLKNIDENAEVLPKVTFPVKFITVAVFGAIVLIPVTFHNAIEALLSLVKVLLEIFPRLKSELLMNCE